MGMPPMTVTEVLARILQDRAALARMRELTVRCRELAAAGNYHVLADVQREGTALALKLNPLAALAYLDWATGRITDESLVELLALHPSN